MALDVAEALDYLHTELNVMHSDLKSRWMGARHRYMPATRHMCCSPSGFGRAAHHLLPKLIRGGGCSHLVLLLLAHWLSLPARAPTCL